MRQLCLVLLIVFSSSSFADSSTDADVAEILDLYVTWREVVANADIAGYVALLDPEVRLIPPGADVVDSAVNYEEFLQPVFKDASYRIQVDRYARVDVVGDYAVAEYDYTIFLTLKDTEQQITEPGALKESVNKARFFDVLRKNSEGRWKVWRHTWQNKQ
jgi:ketosteroid isomerase-like protein